MIKQLLNLIVLFVFISCQSDSTKEQEVSDAEIEDTVFESSNTPGSDSALIIKNAPVWTADFEEATNTYKIHKPVNARLDTLSAENLVSLVNRGSIHVDFIKTSHDTIYVSVPNSEYLTQRIGSTGAENFMAATTFTLTEIKGIKYVNYKFTEGDHASPGVYSRNDFKNFE